MCSITSDRAPVAGSEIVNAAHVGMADRASEEELLAECLVVAGHPRLFVDDLERNRLLRAAVVGEEHFAHAALAQALTDLVAVVDERTRPERWRSLALLHSLSAAQPGPTSRERRVES